MAGSEAIGYEHSSEYLLENAYYILTPGEGVPEETFRDFYQLIKQMGAIPFPCPRTSTISPRRLSVIFPMW